MLQYLQRGSIEKQTRELTNKIDRVRMTFKPYKTILPQVNYKDDVKYLIYL